jgi:hypothetical protein
MPHAASGADAHATEREPRDAPRRARRDSAVPVFAGSVAEIWYCRVMDHQIDHLEARDPTFLPSSSTIGKKVIEYFKDFRWTFL